MNDYGKWLRNCGLGALLLLFLSTVISELFILGPVYDTSKITFEKSLDTLIVGASHAASGLNPAYFDNSINVANAGEPLFFTYYKTKKLLENNPQINKIIIGISPIHLSQYADMGFFSGSPTSRQSAMDYYMFVEDEFDPVLPIFNADRALAFLKYEVGLPFSFTNDVRVTLNYFLGHQDYTSYKFFGGYATFNETEVNNDVVERQIHEHFYDDNNNPVLSEVGIESIRRIVALLADSNVEGLIVNLPKHEKYMAQLPVVIEDEYYQLINELVQENQKLTFLDLSDMTLPDSYFSNADHLNEIGADYIGGYIGGLQ